MYFFTDPEKLLDQDTSQSFGVINENEYRLNSLFSSFSADEVGAIAMTDGLILVQKINNANAYNIILKPTVQPGLNFPKIDYIIYKGIKSASLINGNKVANADVSDLTRQIHEDAQRWYQSEGLQMPSSEPSADTSLGLSYNASATQEEFRLLDTDSLNKAFYSNGNITLPFITGGSHIGNFDITGNFGIMIIMEKIGYFPTFKLARERDSKLTFPSLGVSPTQAELFRRKHEKEDILAFMDPCAFFGSFYFEGLEVNNLDQVIFEKENDLYNNVLRKYYNRNKIYVDIRNEYDDSFNYYQNYSDTIRLRLDNQNFLNRNYYGNNWPLLPLENQEFSGTNPSKIFNIQIPRGDNEYPLLYYKKAYKETSGFQQPEGIDQFFAPRVLDEHIEFENLLPVTANNTLVSNYYLLKVVKRVLLHNDSTEDFPRLGYSLFKRSYLDNLFPVFDMEIPFANEDYTNLKVYYDTSYIDKVLVSEENLLNNLSGYAARDFTASVGIASDRENINFISLPFSYHTNTRIANDFIPLSGLESINNNPFLIELNDRLSQVNLIRSNLRINGVNRDVFQFRNNEQDNALAYSFDDVIILSITRNEYQQLQALKQNNFTGPYKVYLGVKNISVLTDDNGNDYSSFTYVLRGLTESNGTIQAREVLTNIQSVTAAKIIGFESGHILPIETPCITSDYGWRTLNGGGNHNGLDLVTVNPANNFGANIYAVKGGTVEQNITVDGLDRGGVMTRISSEDNPQLKYYYMHMIVNSNSHLQVGQYVAKGAIIGRLGDTGIGTGPHLHFEIWNVFTNGTINRISPYRVFPELALLPYQRHL